MIGGHEIGRHEVWNLVVDGPPEFFADGVLVHNCDALRYALMARPPRKRRPPERLNDPDVDDFLAEVVKQRERGGRHPVLGRIQM